MKRSDLLFAGFTLLLFLPFIFFPEVYRVYREFNEAHGFAASFMS